MPFLSCTEGYCSYLFSYHGIHPELLGVQMLYKYNKCKNAFLGVMFLLVSLVAVLARGFVAFKCFLFFAVVLLLLVCSVFYLPAPLLCVFLIVQLFVFELVCLSAFCCLIIHCAFALLLFYVSKLFLCFSAFLLLCFLLLSFSADNSVSHQNAMGPCNIPRHYKYIQSETPMWHAQCPTFNFSFQWWHPGSIQLQQPESKDNGTKTQPSTTTTPHHSKVTWKKLAPKILQTLCK